MAGVKLKTWHRLNRPVRLTWWIARRLLVPALLLNPADAAEPERVSIQT